MADCKDDFIERVRRTIKRKLAAIAAQQADAISYYMDLRGNTDTDCQALSQAVAAMLEEADKAICESIQREHGGERLTVPVQRFKHDARTRDKIRAEYNGTNMAEITERYQVSKRTVYNYLK